MRVLRRTWVLLLGVAVLAGCSRADAPGALPPLPSPAVSATTVARQPGAPPSLPAAATAPTAIGASMFSKHYLALLDYALHTGNADVLKVVSDPGCGGCRNLITAVERAKQVGHRVSSADITVVSVVSPAVSGGETVTDLRFRRAAGTVIDDAGQAVAQIKMQPDQDVQLRVRLEQGHWVVSGYRNATSS